MKRKTVFVLLFVFIISPLFSVPIKANIELDFIGENLPEEVRKMLGDEAEKSPEKLITVGNAAEIIKEAAKEAFGSRSGIIAILIVLLAAFYILETLNEAYPDSSVLKNLGILAVTVSAGVIFENMFASGTAVLTACEELSAFTAALYPVMLGSVACAGYTETAVRASVSVFSSVQFFSAAVTSVIIPFSYAYAAVGIGAGISGGIDLQKVSAKVRNFCIITLTFIFCIFTGVMSLQTVLAMSRDTLSKRAIKAAVGTFVPVFGGSLSEGLESVFASSVLMKNSIGTVGIAVVFMLISVPLAQILVNWITLEISSMFCGFFGNESLGSFISVLKDCCMILFASAAAFGIIVLVELSLIILIVR